MLILWSESSPLFCRISIPICKQKNHYYHEKIISTSLCRTLCMGCLCKRGSDGNSSRRSQRKTYPEPHTYASRSLYFGSSYSQGFGLCSREKAHRTRIYYREKQTCLLQVLRWYFSTNLHP